MRCKYSSALRNASENLTFTYQIEAKTFKEAEKDEYQIGVVQEELNQVERHESIRFSPRHENHSIIGTIYGF